jgi:hypothetical protein
MFFARRKLHVGIMAKRGDPYCQPALPLGQSVIPTLVFGVFLFVDRFKRMLAPTSATLNAPYAKVAGIP